MCTAISINEGQGLFGRTLDLECSYGESLVVVGRRFAHEFIYEGKRGESLAIIGVACMKAGRPLFYDAMNEAGLWVAGLNFVGNAVYHESKSGAHNVASYELITWILSQCHSVDEAERLIRASNITPESVSLDMPASPLHWMIADSARSVTVESVEEGIKIYENPFGVLTNNPPFPYHEANVANFMSLAAEPPSNKLCENLKITPYSRGMGAMGLPGDFSSSSRFIRALFSKNYTAKEGEVNKSVSRFFHIMDTVAVPRGCIKTEEGEEVLTVYTSLALAQSRTYYFTTYSSRKIRAVSMKKINLNTDTIVSFPMDTEEDISFL